MKKMVVVLLRHTTAQSPVSGFNYTETRFSRRFSWLFSTAVAAHFEDSDAESSAGTDTVSTFPAEGPSVRSCKMGVDGVRHSFPPA